MRTDTVWTNRAGEYIETTKPTGYNLLINGTDRYLNFNLVSGSLGYGFRDNSGTMQYKNSGGAWTDIGSGGGSMVYPGVGIALSTGSAWDTSITNNSANWNTSYGWGNHASAGYLTTSSASSTYLPLAGGTMTGELDITITGSAPALKVTSSLTNTQAFGAIEVINNATSGVGLHITHTDVNNSQGLVRLDSYSPEIEFVETGQVSPAGKFEIRVQDDIFSINARLADDSGFDEMYLFKHPLNPGVNRITFDAGNTGSDAQIGLYDSDATNVSLSLIAQGTGDIILDGVTTILRGTHDGVLTMASTTGGHTYSFPDATGTIALTSSSITGSAATLTTTRTIWGQNFNGSANVTGTLALGASDLTLTGSVGATGARATKVWTAALESTAMPTVGGTAILTSLTAPQFTTIELGHASDTTLSRVSAGVIAVEGVTIPSISSTSTLTNKRITKRVVTTTDDSTAVIDVDVTDVYELSAVANATTFTLSGTPTSGQTLMVKLKDAGVAKGLTWTGFTAIGVTLPTTTVAGKQHYVGCFYNGAATRWEAIAVSVEA